MLEPLPALIRDRREERKLTQGQLAELAGVSRAQLALLEAGKANITMEFLLKITRVLELTAVWVEGLNILAASPDLKALVQAKEAVAHARALASQFSGTVEELDAATASLDELISRPMLPAASQADIAESARQLTQLRGDERDQAGRTLRDLANGDRVHRAERPEAAKTPARKRSRGNR
ncbi:MAG TPA: helix-turn-helix transcriptional regulator [Thermoanaerobaculia bacterium]|nr:helix-turn-helix transcriptional regulator [Thermoanaerobaculia bacterium]